MTSLFPRRRDLPCRARTQTAPWPRRRRRGPILATAGVLTLLAVAVHPPPACAGGLWSDMGAIPGAGARTVALATVSSPAETIAYGYGGQALHDPAPLTQIYKNGVWSTGAARPVGYPGAQGPGFYKNAGAVTLANDTVLVFGGSVRNATSSGLDTSAASAIYDPIANSWTATGDMPNPTAGKDAALSATLGSDGKIYEAGGIDQSGNPQTGLYVYDPVAGTWSVTPPPPAAVDPDGYGFAGEAVAADTAGHVYLVGGGDLVTNKVNDKVAVYTIATGTWAMGPAIPNTDLPNDVSQGDQAVFASGAVRLLTTWYGPQAYTYTPGASDPAAGTWTTLTYPLAEVVGGMSGPGSDGSVYMLDANQHLESALLGTAAVSGGGGGSPAGGSGAGNVSGAATPELGSGDLALFVLLPCGILALRRRRRRQRVAARAMTSAA